MKRNLLSMFVLMTFSFGFAQNNSPWTKSNANTGKQALSSRMTTDKSHFFDLNFSNLTERLQSANKRGESRSSLMMTFPSADGTLKQFRVIEASVLHPDLAAKYPGIKSYAGQGIDDPSSTIRFSLSDQKGFHGMILSGAEGMSYIDPYTSDNKTYKVYAREDVNAQMPEFECLTDQGVEASSSSNKDNQQKTNDKKLRKYRLALACTAEYGAKFAGSGTNAQKKANILAQLNVTMTRVNGIYERDLAATMELVANNDAILYFGASNSDPWSNEWNTKTQQTIDNIIGNANYDLGHVFIITASNVGNGSAGFVGELCTTGKKGSAFTGRLDPTGDPFDIDFVAHEMGHQFGGYHTMNTCSRSGNGSTEVEPASGSSIMGYAGICATNVQSNSDAHFNYVNIRDISANIQSGKGSGCAQVINISNNPPTANAGADYSIPKSTPFILRGQGTDPDGDAVTYTWGQNDPERASGNGAPSSTWTAGPMFRAKLGTVSPDRYMPQISDVVAGNLTPTWEVVPSVARSMEFSLVVRDNKAGGGQTSDDLMSVSVINVTPFTMSAPNTSVTWNSGQTQTVTWNVGSTNASPINCANVNILLSTDGGLTYPITLLSNTTNDGSANVTVPNNISTTCRVMVAAADNVFYDISNTNFSIEGTVACNAVVPTGLGVSGIGSSTATANWTAVSGATYDVRHKATSSSTWITSDVSGTSTSLSGLSASTQYEVQVRSKCAGGNSSYSTSVNFTTSAVQLNYCTSKGNRVQFEWIDFVSFGGISNSSAANSGYGDFTSQIATVAKGSTNQLIVSAGFSGTAYREDFAIWIDYNQNGTFEASEKVASNSSNSATNRTADVTIPSSALVGQTRMRVSMKYNAAPTACETFADGEVEDYTVNIINGSADTQAPTAPGSLTASNIAQTSLTLNWTTSTDNVGVTGYDVYQGSTLLGTVTGTSEPVTGLTANTAYVFNIRAKDAAGNISTSSNVINVTTLPTIITYCASKGNRVQFEWIDFVSFGGMTNTSAANGGYGDFTSQIATVAKGSTNQLIVSTGFSGSAYREDFAIWIDYNQNGTFETSERVASNSSNSAANRTANVTIPSSALEGQTRMRVSMKYNAAPTSCETFADGEVEDYTVNITNASSARLTSDNLELATGEEFTIFPNPVNDYLNIKVPGGAESVEVYSITGSVANNVVIEQSGIDVSGLKPGIYMVVVKNEDDLMKKTFVKQ